LRFYHPPVGDIIHMNNITRFLLIGSALSIAVTANADPGHGKSKLEFDQLVTPDIIFGSGNNNLYFTTGRSKGVEVGLRAKLRFPKDDLTDYGNSDGTYSFPAIDACPGFSWNPTCNTTPIWSFDWSVNTNYDDSTGSVLSDFFYELGMDSDPSKKTNYTVFDNISPSLIAPAWDHSTGNNTTTSSNDNVAGTAAAYQVNIAVDNVAQNSWNYEFYNTLGTSLEFFDPTEPGEYTIYLKVLEQKGKGKRKGKRKVVAESKIVVLITAP
jgi:hypothetical protein